jgi:hypothetical protein
VDHVSVTQPRRLPRQPQIAEATKRQYSSSAPQRLGTLPEKPEKKKPRTGERGFLGSFRGNM